MRMPPRDRFDTIYAGARIHYAFMQIYHALLSSPFAFSFFNSFSASCIVELMQAIQISDN